MLYINSQLPLIYILKHGVWVLGVPFFVLGVLDRAITTLEDNYVSYLELFCFLITASTLMGWIALKPKLKEKLITSKRIEADNPNSNLYQSQAHSLVTQTRMIELKKHHIISQLHILPFPYLSQIYHLLNLKHLETVHSTSLGKFKVINVCNFQPTQLGGSVQFRTTLNSPVNFLKIWRKSTVDVELTLHTPYMIELNIPVYGGKRMTVMFNVFPLSETAHEFSIDIYTDLQYPKFLLQVVLHIASIVTLYEDLPYLKKLSERGSNGFLTSNRVSTNETMWLFKRFISLHGSGSQLLQTT